MQIKLDFTTRQNTPENQARYEYNKKDFGRQCTQIYEYLKSGRTLTVYEAMTMFAIGDPRARIRDLRNGGVNILDRETSNGRGRFKTYYIPQP